MDMSSQSAPWWSQAARLGIGVLKCLDIRAAKAGFNIQDYIAEPLINRLHRSSILIPLYTELGCDKQPNSI